MPLCSYLDLINQVDSFPYDLVNKAGHHPTLTTFTNGTQPLGYILPPILAALQDSKLSGSHWTFHGSTVELSGATAKERSANIAWTLNSWRENKTFAVLAGWRDELYAVYAPSGTEYFRLERSGAALFGVTTYGIHMVAFRYSPTGLQIWVPRRSLTKSTFAGLLDNTVAGGMPAGMGAYETLLKESEEEASLPEAVVKHSKAVGAVTYFYIRDKRAGGEEGLLQPEVQYIYDLEVGEDVVPKPCDDEVHEFMLWDVKRVESELKAGNFKPNCGLVIIDFFLRHGFITAENEVDYLEIVERLHRRLPFPTRK